jgi:ubiquinone/menaquinone biosynthesis C-methylase UbiE
VDGAQTFWRRKQSAASLIIEGCPESLLTDLNPHAKQMADESMVRTLDAQARAIWPQEEPLLRQYKLPTRPRILDAGCGTGEGSSRLAEMFPQAQVLGIDIIESHLELARERYAKLAPRLKFEYASIFELGLGDGTFDLTVCRHVMHSIPHPERVVAELARVTKPGGYLHIIAEDYGMLQFQRATPDPNEFWYETPRHFTEKTGADLFIGRNISGFMAGAGLKDVRIDYIVVDTLRVPRETFAQIITAWRDGYAGPIGELTPISKERAISYFNQMIANIRDPQGYAVWMVPVASAKVPARRG